MSNPSLFVVGCKVPMGVVRLVHHALWPKFGQEDKEFDKHTERCDPCKLEVARIRPPEVWASLK